MLAAAAAVHKTIERHLLIALAVLVVVLAVQGLYSRSLTLQLRDVASALAALKAVVEEQAAALEELDAL
jgi:cell division protein FtsL